MSRTSGFEIIATVAGEIERPGKLIPLTMILSVVSVTLLYVVIMVVSTGVVPYQELGGSLVPVSDVAAISMFGTVGIAAVTFAAAVAAISSSNSSILAASRVIFAMGRDSLMSERLNVTHDRFSTPHRAIITTGAVTGGLILLGLQVVEIVALLAQVASFSFLVTYALVHVAVVVFRSADPDEYDPDFKLPGLLYPTVPVLGIVTAAVVVSQMRAPVIAVGVGVVVLGVVWYAVYARDRAVEEGLADEAVDSLLDELPAFLPGSTPTETAEEKYTVIVPVANPETQHGLLRLAAASARAHADEKPELVAINVIKAEDTSRRNVESDRLDHQRALLENVHDITDGMDVAVRTRSLVEPDVGEAIVRVATEEEADQVLMGWNGLLARDDHVFGTTLDPVLSDAPCDVSLAEIQSDTVGRPVALAGPGPHSPKAAERAVEFATVEGMTPVLLNVQPPAPDGDADPVQRGHEAVAWVADRAGIDREDYEAKVVVDKDTESAILDAVDEFETICVGLSEKSDRSRILFGSIAERISQRETGNVVVVRSAESEGGVPDATGEPLARQDDT
ncbi:MAG: amino acid permease [Halobacteriales archaeon]|nr:amino acid permease [Halobacteriales archaeon]